MSERTSRSRKNPMDRQGSRRSMGSNSSSNGVRFSDEKVQKSAQDEAEKQAMEERVRRLVSNIYGKEVEKHRKRQFGEIRKSEELEKLLPPARTPEEEEAQKLVRKRAEEYMEKGWRLWTDEIRALRDYYLKLISGDTYEDNEVFFDSKAVITSSSVVRKGDLKSGVLH